MVNLSKFKDVFDDEFLNRLNTMVEMLVVQGKSVQDIVAKGQLTPTQYANLIEIINGNLKKGEITAADFDKNGKLFDGTFFTADFIQALNNGEIVVTNVLPKTIGKTELVDNGVGIEQVGFISKNKNMLDVNLDKLITGKAQTNTGGMIDSATASTTDYFIEVEPNTTYFKNFIGSILEFNADGEIENYHSYSSTEGAFTTTANTRRIKLSFPTHRRIDGQLEKGNKATAYVPYERYIDKSLININGTNIQDNSIGLEKLSGTTDSKNLYNKREEVEGYINAYGGLEENTANRAVRFIRVEEDTDYTLSGVFSFGKTNYAFHDEFGTFIEWGDNENPVLQRYEKTIRTPNKTAFMSISANRNSSSIQLEKGNKATPYEAYYKYFPQIVQPNQSDGIGTSKPNTLEVVGIDDVIFKFPLSDNKKGSFRYSNNSTGDDFLKGRESAIFDNQDQRIYGVTNDSSNKEFALRVFDESDANDQWFPEHNKIATAFTGTKGFIKLIADGNEVDLKQSGQIINFNNAKLIQKIECKLPTDTSTRAIITFISEIENGVNNNKVKIEWLRDSKISSGYIFMVPMNTLEFVDNLLTEDFTQLQSKPNATTQTSTEIPNIENTEFIFTSNRVDKKDIVFRTKIFKQSEKIKRLSYQHRSGIIEKLYPYNYIQTEKSAGDIDYFEAEYSIELLPRANEIFTNN